MQRKRHFCGECERWYVDSSSFATHVKNKHRGKLPKGSKTPRTECKVNFPYRCVCGKEFKRKKRVEDHVKDCDIF